jgi:hypothetical protein
LCVGIVFDIHVVRHGAVEFLEQERNSLYTPDLT